MSFHTNKSNFTLDSLDLREYQIVTGKRLARLANSFVRDFAINLVAWICIGLFLVASIKFYKKHDYAQEELLLIFGFFLLAVTILFTSNIFRQRVLNNIGMNKNGWFFQTQSFEFDNGFLTTTSILGRSEYKLSELIDIEEGQRNIYLFIDNAQAIVLPKLNVDIAELKAQVTSKRQV